MSAHLYMLLCADGSFYVGSTRGDLEKRIAEHAQGLFDGYTARRRPATLVYSEEFERIEDAVAAERQVKGWRREKKEALIRGDLTKLPMLSRRGGRSRATAAVASFETPPAAAPQDEGSLYVPSKS